MELVRLRLRLKPRAARTLTDLANIYKSDKGDMWFSRHSYTKVYDEIFADYKTRPLTILEIGLRHDPFYKTLSRISPSVQMWRDYFANALICGFDINDFSAMDAERVRIFRGDQGNPDDLRRVINAIPEFDIIIDDGSHASYDQLVSLKTLFSALKPGGRYIIEDLHWQPAELEESLPRVPKMSVLLQDVQFLEELGLAIQDVSFLSNAKLAIIRKQRSTVETSSLKSTTQTAVR